MQRVGDVMLLHGRLEVSGGIVEEKHVTLERHLSSAVDLTKTNSCQLNSTHMTPTNCSRVTSKLVSLQSSHMQALAWTDRQTERPARASDHENFPAENCATRFSFTIMNVLCLRVVASDNKTGH